MNVQARDRDRETVLHRLADRNRQVTDLIRGYGEAVEKLESGTVSVRPELKLDLAPAKQAVSAQVEARFAMTRPAPGQPGS